jgi:hypothetical protein
MKKGGTFDLEENRATFLLVGVILALAVVWLFLEWHRDPKNPRQFILVGVPMHIEQIRFHKEYAMLNNRAQEVDFRGAQAMLKSYLPEFTFFENQRMGYLCFRLDTAAKITQLDFYNLGDYQYLRKVKKQILNAQPTGVHIPYYMQKACFVLPLYVPEQVQR